MLHSFVNFYAKVLKILIRARSISHKNISNSQRMAFITEISCGRQKRRGCADRQHIPLDELKK
jgi:hypothetical protein